MYRARDKRECFDLKCSLNLLTAICIQAQTANVLTRCLRFRTWRLPFETEAIQMRKYAN